MSPRQLEDTGFADKLGCVVAAPPPGHGTIRRGDGKQVAIDMFLATAAVIKGTRQAKVQVQHRAVPHWPVEIRVSARTEMVPVFVLPRAGGTEILHGPTSRARQSVRAMERRRLRRTEGSIQPIMAGMGNLRHRCRCTSGARVHAKSG